MSIYININICTIYIYKASLEYVWSDRGTTMITKKNLD